MQESPKKQPRRKKFDVTTFGVTMRLEWDEAKNRANIRKHGLDFADAEEIFGGVLLAEADTREDYGEKRWVGLGQIGGRTVKIIFSEQDPETIRIISLRKATRYERKEYEKALQHGLETN
jgi:uncharacterized DUF497 family protein